MNQAFEGCSQDSSTMVAIFCFSFLYFLRFGALEVIPFCLFGSRAFEFRVSYFQHVARIFCHHMLFIIYFAHFPIQKHEWHLVGGVFWVWLLPFVTSFACNFFPWTLIVNLKLLPWFTQNSQDIHMKNNQVLGDEQHLLQINTFLHKNSICDLENP